MNRFWSNEKKRFKKLVMRGQYAQDAIGGRHFVLIEVQKATDTKQPVVIVFESPQMAKAQGWVLT